MKTGREWNPTDAAPAVRAHLEKVLASEHFSHAESLSRFLRYVVEQTLDGRRDEIKEYTVGVEVFRRGESFDPRVDTIVRVQARKLRAKLGKYYGAANGGNDVRIDLAPGSYVPEFCFVDAHDKRTGNIAPHHAPGSLQAARRWPWMLAGASAAASVGLLAWVITVTMKPRSPTGRTVPLTSLVGSERQPSLSPDSSQVAFSWDGERQDNFDIYVKQIGSGGPRRLTTHAAPDRWPTWSRDGRWIAFQRYLEEQKIEVLVMPALGGGPERKIAQVSGRPEQMGMSWSADSRWLALSDCSASNQCRLFLLSSETGEKRQLTTPPANYYGDSAPAFSPDGRTLAFLRLTGARSGEVFLLSLSSDLQPLREPKRLTNENKFAHQLAWAPDGNALLLVLGQTAADLSLWTLGVRGSPKPEPVPAIEGNIDSVAVGRHVVYATATGDSNVWRAPVSSGDASPASFLATTRLDMMAEYSPDGQRIAFISNRSGRAELWVCDADGGNSHALASLGGRSIGVPNWSPDGQQIVFYGSPQGQADIFSIRSAGGDPKRLTMDIGMFPRFSRDGKWIYFGSSRAGGVQVWKMPAGGGPAQQVSRHGGNVAVESVDQKYLYYSRSNELLRIPIEGGEEEKVLQDLASISTFQVTADGIYWIARQSGDRLSIRFLEFRTGRIRIVAPISRPVGFHLSVSPDQRWALYTQVDTAGGDLMLVENYRP